MSGKSKSDILYIKNLPYVIMQTARVSYLLGKNYYKNVVKTILELDEYTILSFLVSDPLMSQSDLSKAMYKGKAHIGKILNEMETKGYIKRIVGTSDNMMKKFTEITDLGAELYENTHETFRKLADEVLSIFTDEELETFLSLLDRYKDKITSTYEIDF